MAQHLQNIGGIGSEFIYEGKVYQTEREHSSALRRLDMRSRRSHCILAGAAATFCSESEPRYFFLEMEPETGAVTNLHGSAIRIPGTDHL